MFEEVLEGHAIKDLKGVCLNDQKVWADISLVNQDSLEDRSEQSYLSLID